MKTKKIKIDMVKLVQNLKKSGYTKDEYSAILTAVYSGAESVINNFPEHDQAIINLIELEDE